MIENTKTIQPRTPRSLAILLDQRQRVVEEMEQLKSAFNYYHVQISFDPIDHTGDVCEKSIVLIPGFANGE